MFLEYGHSHSQMLPVAICLVISRDDLQFCTFVGRHQSSFDKNHLKNKTKHELMTYHRGYIQTRALIKIVARKSSFILSPLSLVFGMIVQKVWHSFLTFPPLPSLAFPSPPPLSESLPPPPPLSLLPPPPTSQI